MYYDNEAIKDTDHKFLVWSRQMNEHVARLINKVTTRYGVTAQPNFYSNGSFNFCYKVRVDDGFEILFRFPILGKSSFRYEKTNDECHILIYLSRYTTIPIPEILATENTSLGPFIAMRFVTESLLSERLRIPNSEGRAFLDPNINIQVLMKAYGNMAQILLELSKCRFAQIGGLIRDDSKNWRIGKRAWTLNMNELISGANCPPHALSRQAFPTANDYFTALAEDHITHLRTQRNDAVDDENDCRKKYIARHLFRIIARKFSSSYNHGPFPLFCDDLRPSNVIVDADLNVQSVIDWEYCYAAPVEFTYCSPWWLLLARPEDFEQGYEWFSEQYLPRHELFLKVLRERENEAIQRNDLFESQRLSNGMAKSLENGHFWFCLAATSSFEFDDIYWRFIDPVYYGEFTSLDDRLALLSQDEQNALEPFVSMKMEQALERKLDEHRDVMQVLND
ncbi:putative phosphotransferase enzyme family protein [Phaeomoniella chlamydospora]|uniref:Putative phosphotransferase enzyme family protein n=1 Tax=Phaeomoniella chlamydospora TaxID=158046 RepID=A0A0G2GUI4_PHACM|nr:putative phosphotransferase enzyme family protein [Phaeomoniella chlamydospora]